MERGDIVLIHFPFTNLKNFKLRPALIISNEKFNKHSNVILLAISTKPGPKGYSVLLDQNDLNSGKLLKKSYIRYSNILSIEKKLILKKVATLKETKSNLIARKLSEFFQ